MEQETCWTMVRGAAGGDAAARERFSRLYLDAISAYLAFRWRGSPFAQDVSDAVGEVFLECFKADGALERAEQDRGEGFRALLYGVARNVARRFEERAARGGIAPRLEPGISGIAADETELSKAFDRAFARGMMRRAMKRMEAAASSAGDEASRRVELLRLRFTDDLPIREIASRFAIDATKAHHEYARARGEFKVALLAEVAFERPGSRTSVEQECLHLLGLVE